MLFSKPDASRAPVRVLAGVVYNLHPAAVMSVGAAAAQQGDHVAACLGPASQPALPCLFFFYLPASILLSVHPPPTERPDLFCIYLLTLLPGLIITVQICVLHDSLCASSGRPTCGCGSYTELNQKQNPIAGTIKLLLKDSVLLLSLMHRQNTCHISSKMIKLLRTYGITLLARAPP
jgi:hypothetical protein